MGRSHFDMYCGGAAVLAGALDYGEIHRRHGLSQPEWDLLTMQEVWSVDDRRKIRSILSEVVQISFQIAGLPAQPIPGQYIAAIIAMCVAPCNRMVAATRAPDSYDAAAASGLEGDSEIVSMTVEQMIALVHAFSIEGPFSEPSPQIDAEVIDIEDKAQKTGSVRRRVSKKGAA